MRTRILSSLLFLCAVGYSAYADTDANSQSLLASEITMARNFLDNSNYGDKTSALAAIAEAESLTGDAATREDRLKAVAKIRAAANEYLALRPSEWVNITNGLLWYDQNGNSVQAHAAGFVQIYDTWYMIGEDRSNSWNPDVNMYKSKDLVHWDFVKKIIENKVSHPELGVSRMIERPKLMYCPNTGKFVVWCHWESSNYGASEAGVFVADTVDGEYTFVSGERPLGVKSRDCNVFIDDDNTAYFISTIEENQHLGLFKLSDDYLRAEEYTVLFNGKKREAPAIVKVDGIYYMLSSACSGWEPNQCKLATTENLTEGWSGLTNIGNGIAYDTQAANILTVTGTKGTSYLYVGDRWKDPELPESKTIIFPVDFKDRKCTFDYRRTFDFNPAEGLWREAEVGMSFLDRAGWSVIGCSTEEISKENGAAANVLDGNPKTIWHTNYSDNKGVAPHFITVDMGTEMEIGSLLYTPRTDNSQNGIARAFILQTSLDAKQWNTIAGGSWLPYWSTIYFPSHKAQYFKFHILESEYGSAAEFELAAPGNETFPDGDLKLYYTLDNGTTWVEGNEINVESGATVKFGPNSKMLGGSWAFEGKGVLLSGREQTLENVTVDNAGKYTTTFLSPSGMAYSATYQLTIDGVTEGVDAVFGDGTEVVASEYYSIDGCRIHKVVDKGLSVKVDTLKDGRRKVSKILN